MKPIALLFIFLFPACIAFCQCDSNHLFKKGNKFQVSTYWWAGFGLFFELPKMTYEVQDTRDSSGWRIATVMKSSSQNKGRSVFNKQLTISCNGSQFFYDPAYWLMDTILQKELNKAMDIKTDTLFYFAIGTPASFPFTSKAGDNLQPYKYMLSETDVFSFRDEKTSSNTRYSGNDAITTTTTTSKPGVARLYWNSREVNFDKRTVEGIETITTSAGTWQCLKIVNKDSHAKGMYRNISIVDYYAPGFGLVRQESYYKKRRTAYTEVTKIY